MTTRVEAFYKLPLLIRLAATSIAVVIVLLAITANSKVNAAPPPLPACPPANGCAVPDGWPYPGNGNQPINNLCSQRSVLVPNASVFPSGTTTTSSTINMQIWYGVFICSNHTGGAPESTSSVAWIVNINGTDYTFGSHNNASDGNVGGHGGYWVGISANNLPLNVGNNNVCHRLQGSISESPFTFSNLGYCTTVVRNNPPVNVQARVFRLNSDGTFNGNEVGRQVEHCRGGSLPTTNASGIVNFSVPSNEDYCVRANGGPPSGYTGPFVRPYGEGYASCPGFGSVPSNPTHCTDQPDYECQRAGGLYSTCFSIDRASDSGFDIIYIATPPPINVQARVFRLNNDGTLDGNEVGRQVNHCRGGSLPVTNASGIVNFTVPQGQEYCIQSNGAAPLGFTGPFIRPFGEGYAECPSFSGTLPSNPTHCATQTAYGCQWAGGVYPSCFGVDRSSDSGFDIIYIENAPPAAILDGVKIDNSGVGPSGASSPPWGGNCHINSGQPTSNCNNGTLANYPFSDNCVRIDSGSCATVNNFEIIGITPGTHTISITPSGTSDGSWSLLGYKICATGGGCTTQFLTTTPLNGGSSFSHTFASNTRYSMRWIYNIPYTLSCGGVTTLVGGVPGTAEPNSPFFIRVSFNIASGTFNDSSRQLRINSISPAGVSGIALPATQNYTLSGSSGYADFGPVMASGFGPYTVTYELTGTSVNGCTGQIGTENRPYMRLYGGDVLAGSNFSTVTCTPPGSARFIAWNKGNTAPAGGGSGNQLAVFAKNRNVDFISAAMRVGAIPAPNPLTGLTFANSGVPQDINANANYGGTLDDGFFTANCIPDLYTEALSNNASVLTPNSLLGAINLGSGIRRENVVDGDIYINENITYTNAAAFGINPDSIPSFRLVARGNIYIHPNVTRIDGTLIAQPVASGSAGRIYTCAANIPAYPWGGNSPANVPTAAQQATSCGNRLVINGSVTAAALKLLRTNGTLGNATTGESYTSTTQAETIIFSPELWLRNPRTGSSSNQAPYKSITALPPIL